MMTPTPALLTMRRHLSGGEPVPGEIVLGNTAYGEKQNPGGDWSSVFCGGLADGSMIVAVGSGATREECGQSLRAAVAAAVTKKTG